MMDGMRRVLLAAMLLTLLAGCTGTGLSPEPSPGVTRITPTNGAIEPDTTPGPITEPTPGDTGITATAATASSGPGMTVEPGSTPGPIHKPTPVASVPPLDRVDLRYRLVDGLGRPKFCDPDFYPVARADEAVLAAQHLAAIQADAPIYAAIVAHLGIDPSAAPTPDQVLAIYRDWKMLRALLLTAADGRFSFDYIAAAGSSGETGFHVVGTIDAAGTIALAQRDPSGPPPCPICLARGTRIATPDGERPVEDLRPGMAVWTTDAEWPARGGPRDSQSARRRCRRPTRSSISSCRTGERSTSRPVIGCPTAGASATSGPATRSTGPRSYRPPSGRTTAARRSTCSRPA